VQDFPQDVEPADEIPFAAAILGYKMHRRDDGSFTSKQAGHWMPMKLTIGQDSGEVYLNLNQEESLGEFVSKGYYGETIVKEFAKIILPRQDS